MEMFDTDEIYCTVYEVVDVYTVTMYGRIYKMYCRIYKMYYRIYKMYYRVYAKIHHTDQTHFIVCEVLDVYRVNIHKMYYRIFKMCYRMYTEIHDMRYILQCMKCSMNTE